MGSAWVLRRKVESWDRVAGLVARLSIRMRSGFSVAICELAMGFLHEKEKQKGSCEPGSRMGFWLGLVRDMLEMI